MWPKARTSCLAHDNQLNRPYCRQSQCKSFPGGNSDRREARKGEHDRVHYFVGAAYQAQIDLSFINFTFDCVYPDCKPVQRYWGDTYELLAGKPLPPSIFDLIVRATNETVKDEKPAPQGKAKGKGVGQQQQQQQQ